MNRAIFFRKLSAALGSRLARNIYLWVIVFYLSHQMNVENERAYHYGLIRSSWYWPVFLIGAALQMIMVYANNLILIPRLLVRKRIFAYLVSALLLVTCISLVYTIGLKKAKVHMNVDDMQQPGMVAGPITTEWTAAALIAEGQTYIVGNLLWVFVFTMAWFMNDYARQRRIAEQAVRQQVETELSFLKSQLNPHFLFNTLNNVYALALKRAEETPESVLKLSSILRYLLYESNSALVPFEKEKEVMLAYADLELLRLKDRNRLHFSITADRNYDIPPLLWLPVMENIFKHGTRIISKEVFADYQYDITEGVLKIKASNYCRHEVAGDETKKGIGLSNLQKRLKLLYPGKHSLHTAYADHTFTTELTIRLT